MLSYFLNYLKNSLLHHIKKQIYSLQYSLPFSSKKAMLNTTPQSMKIAKINECIMRRRARNLRAKVKALLPVQTCCKHDHRNQCVHQIQVNRITWSKFSNKKKWTSKQQKQNSYYYEQQPRSDNQNRFEKLSEAEIQQIKEDRLYYLGEDNISDFQSYLRNKDQSAYQIILTAFKSIWVPKQAHQESQAAKDKKLVQSLTESDLSILTTKNTKKPSVEDRQKQFEQRRKIIEFEEKSKRLMNKVKLNMRLERAQAKLDEIKFRKGQQLSHKKEELENQLQKISNRRKNNEHKGQIKNLEQQLRRTFIARKSKTANEVSHSTRTQINYLIS